MGTVVAEIGSILASVIAASSLGAAIKAWFETRRKSPSVQMTLKSGDKTVVVNGDMSGEELQRIINELVTESEASSGDGSTPSGPAAP
ncbi:effector-associated constant component EACC1 [Streptomyces populi]